MRGGLYIIVLTQYEWDILVITHIQAFKAEDKG